MNKNELSHVGVLGMRWGVRRSLAEAHGNAAERHMAKAEKADKLIPHGGNLHRSAAERHKMVMETLKKPFKEVQPMGKKDKRFFKALGIGLAVVGSAKISYILGNRAMEKYYAHKIADSIGTMLRNQAARKVINL
jgi:hypothetical protein